MWCHAFICVNTDVSHPCKMVAVVLQLFICQHCNSSGAASQHCGEGSTCTSKLLKLPRGLAATVCFTEVLVSVACRYCKVLCAVATVILNPACECYLQIASWLGTSATPALPTQLLNQLLWVSHDAVSALPVQHLTIFEVAAFMLMSAIEG